MEIQSYAPVIIPTLCRFEHFKRCVDSLSKCTGANKTILLIGLDYPLKKSHFEGWEQIKAYIPKIKGFKEVRVFERDKNLGAIENSNAVIDFGRTISDRYIFSEDDNEFSPNFLEYVNKGLEKFKENQQIMSICGYVYLYAPQNMKNNAYPAYGFSAYGYGRWYGKPYRYKSMGKEVFLDQLLYSFKASWRLFKLRPTSLNSMVDMKIYNRNYGDCFVTAEYLLYDEVAVFPKLSKVRNWGNDGSGEHCKIDDAFKNQEIDKSLEFEFEDELLNIEPVNFAKYMNVSFVKKTAIILRYLFFRMTGKDLLFFIFR